MSDWKKVFVIIWTGQLFSTLSSAIVGYAVVFWLSVETKSAEVLAFAAIAALLPPHGINNQERRCNLWHMRSDI